MLRTKLASLVKGRWIDGKAQTVALLLPACYTPTLFILQTFLPSRRRDCFPTAPSMRFSALSPSLFVGRVSVCAWLALRPCKALGHTRLRHPCLACPSRCAKPFHPHNPLKSTSIPRPTPNLPKTALYLDLHQHPCLLINALPVSQNVANRHHPCLPSKKGRWHG